MKHLSSQYLTVTDPLNQKSRRISYYKVEGSQKPGVLFVPGFMANKDRKKSIEMLNFCSQRDISCVSFDACGVGDSNHEVKITEVRFTHWLQDLREVITHLTDGPQVVIGSSMGGWLSMIVAKEMPENFAGLVMLAPAYNWGEMALRDIEKNIPEDVKKQMREGLVLEKVDEKFPDYGPMPVSYGLYEGLLPFTLPLGEAQIELDFPVRIIHGTKDEIFPVQTSQTLIDAIKTDDVQLLIIKGCLHELSDPKGLAAIFAFVEELRKMASK